MQETTRNFKFSVPLDLIKADDKGWHVSGLASTEDKDLQGEIVRQDGLDISALKAGRGFFNYEHRHNPEDLVGCIEDAEVKPEGLFVKGYLFKEHKRAQALAQIMQSLKKGHNKRVQLSIEGKVRERAGDSVLKRAKVEHVAITFEPVNSKTYVQFAKSLVGADQTTTVPEDLVKIPETLTTTPTNINVEVNGHAETTVVLGQSDPMELTVPEETIQAAIEEIKEEDKVSKMLVAGGGNDVPPATMTGANALSGESLEGAPDKPKKKKKYPIAVQKALVIAAWKFLAKSYPQATKEQLKDLILNGVVSRLIRKGEQDA